MKKLLFLLLMGVSTLTYSQDVVSGKELFNTNCAGCHNMEKKVVGPALENTIELQGREWTSKWIANSAELIASGDAHATEIYAEYNQMAMPAFNYLKTEELNAILDYMEGFKKEKEAKVAEAQAAAPTTTTEQPSSSTSSSIPTFVWILIVLTLGVVLVFALVILATINFLGNHITKIQSTNDELNEKLNLSKPKDDMTVD